MALRGFDLDQAAKERVESVIQTAVLHEAAALDSKGTVDMTAPVERRRGSR